MKMDREIFVGLILETYTDTDGGIPPVPFLREVY
jgi:hypothetical protein